MDYALLGNTGLIVSRLSFGAVTFTAGDTMRGIARVEHAEADALVGQALDAGINFFDTADIYASGQSETLLGQALGPHRDDVVIATKVGGRMGPSLLDYGLTRRHIMSAIDASLRRLGTDRVDVYIAHAEDPHTPLEETLEALDAVVRAGKARYIGFSNWSAWRVATAMALQKANGWARFSHGQMYYSLVGRDIERDVVPMMAHHGLGLTVWSPLASGFLSGKYTPDTLSDPANRLGNIPLLPFDQTAGFALVEEMRTIAQAAGASVAQIALAWLLAKPAVTSIILGASKTSQLADNLGALDVKLDPAIMARLDAAMPPAILYPQWHRDGFADAAVAAALA
jgi:aryl-alcohol dehydrogenase-like predicted oxidoreductase